jgi:hypothetical protein
MEGNDLIVRRLPGGGFAIYEQHTNEPIAEVFVEDQAIAEALAWQFAASGKVKVAAEKAIPLLGNLAGMLEMNTGVKAVVNEQEAAIGWGAFDPRKQSATAGGAA